jgi:hypothetical protein|tara:strand:- start:1551 stop:2216 length:666 start_codon:yes stop_codon:yes gene_type:complete
MGLTSNTGLFNAAAEIYGVDDLVMNKRPRQKYNFSVFMQIDSAAVLSNSEYGKAFTFDKVSGVSLPDYQYNVTRLNQYNHHRYITTKQEITPASITFYDTVDNHWQSLMTDYAGYYYSQGLTKLSKPFAPNATNDMIDSPSGVKAIKADGRFFFNQISIGTVDTFTRGRTITMYNCLITSASHDRLDYSDSTPVMWTVQFQPEHVAFETAGSSTQAPLGSS